MRSILIYLSLVTIVMSQASCEKQLNAPPRNARVEGTAITNQASAQTALNGAYYRFASVTTTNADATNWWTHQTWGAMLTGNIAYGYGAQADESNNNVQSSFSGSAWNETYLLLTAVNGVIDGVSQLNDKAFTGNRKKEILAEARFLRAYGHSRLLFYFGEWFKADSPFGVLLRTEPITLSNIPKARSSVAESYAQILSDIDEAIANGPEVNAAYYATKWAAMQLKMRVLMMRGQSADYPLVIELANKIIAAPNYALENNLKDIFQLKGLASREVILGIKPQPNQEIGYYNHSGSYYPGNSALYASSIAFQNLLTSDPRASWMIGPLTGGSSQNYSPGVKYFCKYVSYGTGPSQLTEVSYAMRLTEVYLLKAEAILRSGGSLADARTLMKTVMQKAGVTDFSAVDGADTKDKLLLQNYFEVSRNLVAEDGLEWMALLRLPFETVKQVRPTITNQIQYYFPIPRTELQQNKLFGLQNPGYAI